MATKVLVCPTCSARSLKPHCLGRCNWWRCQACGSYGYPTDPKRWQPKAK